MDNNSHEKQIPFKRKFRKCYIVRSVIKKKKSKQNKNLMGFIYPKKKVLSTYYV